MRCFRTNGGNSFSRTLTECVDALVVTSTEATQLPVSTFVQNQNFSYFIAPQNIELLFSGNTFDISDRDDATCPSPPR